MFVPTADSSTEASQGLHITFGVTGGRDGHKHGTRESHTLSPSSAPTLKPQVSLPNPLRVPLPAVHSPPLVIIVYIIGNSWPSSRETFQPSSTLTSLNCMLSSRQLPPHSLLPGPQSRHQPLLIRYPGASQPALWGPSGLTA